MDGHTMIRHPHRTVLVASLRLPGDIETRRKKQHVIELGNSFDASGGQPAESPIVEHHTLRLIAGCDRVAACLNKGIKAIIVLPVEGSPEELERLALVENVRRRHGGHDHELARLLELEHPSPEQTFPAIEDDVPWDSSGVADNTRAMVGRPVGRPSEGKREALEAVAAVAGRTPEAVRRAEYRDRKASEPEPKAEPCIDTLGLDVPEAVLADAAVWKRFLSDLRATLVRAQSSVTEFAGIHGNAVLRIKEGVHASSALAGMLMPASVCPYCKCTKLKHGCHACHKRGWVSASVRSSVTDKKLLATGANAGIYVDGKWVALKDVMP
jgi:hypothetical protein